ncbi:MAG: hypothetical protein ACE5D0_03625 [Fidelibacterota bacterium]
MSVQRLMYCYLILIIFTTILFPQRPYGKQQMANIGILQGTVLDSSNNQSIEFASVSLISLRTKEITTGGFTDKNGDNNGGDDYEIE